MTRPIQFLMPDQRTVQLLPWSDADLNQMSQVGPRDIKDAAAYWREHLPRRLRTILDARSTIPRL